MTFKIGQWVHVKPPEGGFSSMVRETAEIIDFSNDGQRVLVRFLSDSEVRDYDPSDLDLAHMQP